MELKIRRAKQKECTILSQLSNAMEKESDDIIGLSKLWKEESKITVDYIRSNIVYIAEVSEKIIGYFSIIKIERDYYSKDIFIHQGCWIEYFMIKSTYDIEEVGTAFIEVAKKYCKENNISEFYVLSEIAKKNFYEKSGATYVEEYYSTMDKSIAVVYRFYCG